MKHFFNALKRVFTMDTAAQRQTAWRAFCLLEKAVKKGPHVHVKHKIFDVLSPDPDSMIKYLESPIESGGKGVYKVLFYCDGSSAKEQQAFNNQRTRFLYQFQTGLPGNIEI